jgi:hypothetical protein
VRVPAVLRFEANEGVAEFARVRIENASDVPWPGLDIQREGMVLLRTVFLGEDGGRLESAWPLDTDVPARATRTTRVAIKPPVAAGRYRVRFDLVQQRGEALAPLGVPPVEREIQVVEREVEPIPWRAEPRQ